MVMLRSSNPGLSHIKFIQLHGARSEGHYGQALTCPRALGEESREAPAPLVRPGQVLALM